MQSGMLQGETWKLAWDALRSNKVRAALTTLGVVIGSCCIVAVVTVALAGRRYIISQIEGIGANLVYAELVRSGVSRALSVSDEITLRDLEAVKQGIPQVVEAAGTRDIPMSVVVNSAERPVSLVGVTEGFQQIRNLLVLRGRYFDPDDMRSRSKVCLLTQQLAATAFPQGDPVGKEIRIGELRLSIIGVFRERIATFGQSEISSESVIVPLPLIRDYMTDEYLGTLYAQADTAEDVPAVTKQVAEILESRHRPGAKYNVQNLSNLLEAAHRIAMALSAVLVLVALIALAISGVGIMNIMLVTVTERTREIGIRKAIGAPRDAILYQFLIEALLISGSGALLGILIAVSVPALVNFLMSFFPEAGPVSIPISWISVVLAFVVSCSTGLVFGYLPANRAARMHPTDSLRYE
jgi:putative ABC transport system permease protein